MIFVNAREFLYICDISQKNMDNFKVTNIKVRTKLFIRFLKENNCYKEYMFNLYYNDNKGWNYELYNLKDVMHRIKINGFYGSEIDISFKWKCTEQGYDFWKNIDKKWRDLIYECEKKKKNIFKIS